MPEVIRAPKGVIEYLPPSSRAFEAVRDTLLESARLAGYGLVELPVFEDTDLYVRGVGESTDVVGKEMYTFDDRGGRSISLRPEGTAGVVRSVIEHSLDRQGLPIKLAYSGPFFRAERPQQGRYRQFSQVGVEAIGSQDPELDAEVIAVAVEGFRRLGLQGFRLILNNLGDTESRAEYREVLTSFLNTLDLDEQTRRRAVINPLRVLDDKRHEVRQLLRDAPLLTDVLTPAARRHSDQVAECLQALGIEFELDPRLVRGLDYYTRTTFEFVHDGLGAQSAIGGGGRYDGLVEQLGGPELSGIGFGLGVDRTLLACEAEGLSVGLPSSCDVYVIASGMSVGTAAVELCAALRNAGIRTDRSFDGRSLKGSMRAANRTGARYVVLVESGPDLSQAHLVLKDMQSSQQQDCDISELISTVQENLS